MLSRLKGIETLPDLLLTICLSLFRYAFPFEGNWNYMMGQGLVVERALSFRYAFPFEGNWNPLPTPTSCFSQSTVQICFPVWRELKRFTKPEKRRVRDYSSDMLSRLKGIETHNKTSLFFQKLGWVQICFPVWRELKHTPCITTTPFEKSLDTLSRLKGIETIRWWCL